MVHKIHKIALVTDDIEETVRFLYANARADGDGTLSQRGRRGLRLFGRWWHHTRADAAGIYGNGPRFSSHIVRSR